MTQETEIVSAALRMIRDYGFSAAERADEHAATLLREGDKDGSALWQKVAETIRSVQADNPAHWFGSDEWTSHRKKRKG